MRSSGCAEGVGKKPCDSKPDKQKMRPLRFCVRTTRATAKDSRPLRSRRKDAKIVREENSNISSPFASSRLCVRTLQFPGKEAHARLGARWEPKACHVEHDQLTKESVTYVVGQFVTHVSVNTMTPLRSTIAISWNTFTELVRMKVFYFLLIFALLIIGNSAFVANLSFQEQFQMLKDISLGAMSVFTSLLAILATANFLPKDMEDRTIYTILAKPVPRFSYLLGKLMGIFLLLALATLTMTCLFLLVLWLREQGEIGMLRAQLAGAPPEQIAAGMKEISGVFNINLLPGIMIVFIKAAVLASLTLLLSTFSTSALFTTLMAVAVYFIGHLQATAREYWQAGSDVSWLASLLSKSVALVFPDLQAFNFVDDVIAGTAVPLALFLKTAALGGLYVAVYFSLAAFIFSDREL